MTSFMELIRRAAEGHRETARVAVRVAEETSKGDQLGFIRVEGHPWLVINCSGYITPVHKAHHSPANLYLQELLELSPKDSMSIRRPFPFNCQCAGMERKDIAPGYSTGTKGNCNVCCCMCIIWPYREPWSHEILICLSPK